MIRPQHVLIDAFLDDARKAVCELREHGWAVETRVDYIPATRGYEVTLRFELPHITIPFEAEMHGRD